MPKHEFLMRWSRQISVQFFWSTVPSGSSGVGSTSLAPPPCHLQSAAGIGSLSMDDLESDTMDENVWCNLPLDLVDKVVARLPLACVFRLRTVCQRWNKLLYSASFLALGSDLPSPPPWFILCTHGAAMPAYDVAAGRWHRLPIPDFSMPAIAASGSLLCFGDQIGECKSLAVCNPVTRMARELPCMPQVRFIHKVGMLSDAGGKNYHILVVGESATELELDRPDHVYDLITEVYDRSTDCWSRGGVPLEHAKFGTDPGAWIDGVFYCITEMPYGVVCYDLRRGVWSELVAPMPQNLVCPCLVDFNGRLLMVGKVLDSSWALPRADSIVIWEHVPGQGRWQEVTRVPSTICAEFFEGLVFCRIRFVCAVLESTIFVTTFKSPHCLTYDLDRRLWNWLPRDPFYPDVRDGHLVGFSIQPRLDRQA